MLKSLLLIISAFISFCLPINTTIAQDFYFQQKYVGINNDIFNNCGKICPELEYQLVDTGYSWIDATINKAVVSHFINIDENDNSNMAQKWQQFTQTATPTDSQYAEQLTKGLQKLITENKELMEMTDDRNTPLIAISVEPKYIGHKANIEMIDISGFSYMGGAHGVSYVNHFAFDMKNKQLLTLDDILLPNKKSALENIVKQSFKTWLINAETNPEEHLQSWEFHLTDNFTFTKEGVQFLYQPYEITPYAMGMPELVIPYQQLKGIIKPEYL